MCARRLDLPDIQDKFLRHRLAGVIPQLTWVWPLVDYAQVGVFRECPRIRLKLCDAPIFVIACAVIGQAPILDE